MPGPVAQPYAMLRTVLSFLPWCLELHPLLFLFQNLGICLPAIHSLETENLCFLLSLAQELCSLLFLSWKHYISSLETVFLAILELETSVPNSSDQNTGTHISLISSSEP
jgi:hypothetical protein